MTLPRVEPMRAVVGELPDAGDDRWAYEIKWDGVRALGAIDEDGHLRLCSSNGIDITARYPELAPLGAELHGHTAVLDGEIVTFNADGRPDFGLLQPRMHVNDAKAAAEWAARQPVVWVLFDLLELDGHVLYADRPGAAAGRPTYEDRRRLLEDLVEPGPNWQVPKAQRGGGAELLAAVADRGMEGLMAKRLGSPYLAGRRSADWRKLKVRRRQELVVGGWKPGDGGRAGTIGSVLVGYYDDDGRLVYAGGVGSGLSQAEIAHLEAVFAATARDDCPFDVPPRPDESRGARWVAPEVVVEVAFAEWSADGRLRHPSYLGRRMDKSPRSVVREP